MQPDDLVVIHVGRMAAEKNYPLLFRAFDAIKNVNPRARLVLVGDGPMLSAYQRQRPDVIFTGFYTGTNLARHYASGDIYLHASVTETFGNVITEALASGLAFGAFDYAAAHEFVRHGENGLVAPARRRSGLSRQRRPPCPRTRPCAPGFAAAGRPPPSTLLGHGHQPLRRDLLEVVAAQVHRRRASPKSRLPNQ